jgi:hypothetical protein
MDRFDNIGKVTHQFCDHIQEHFRIVDFLADFPDT